MSKFHIGYILDMSGSMADGGSDVPGGVANYIDSTKKEIPDASFTLTIFDTVFETWVDSLPLSAINGKELVRKYQPRGGTALYDAVGNTIDKIKRQMHVGDRAIVVITTDGEENSSRVENEKSINKKIKKLQKTGDWTFVFIGTEIDAWDAARKIGIYDGNVAVTSYGKGQFRAPAATSRGTVNFYRSAATSSSSLYADSNLSQDYTENNTEETVFDVDSILGTTTKSGDISVIKSN